MKKLLGKMCFKKLRQNHEVGKIDTERKENRNLQEIVKVPPQRRTSFLLNRKMEKE